MKKQYAHNYRIVKETIVLSQEEQMIQAEFRAFLKHLQTNLSIPKNFDGLIETLEEMVKETAKFKKGL
jgi:hypothetical protein